MRQVGLELTKLAANVAKIAILAVSLVNVAILAASLAALFQQYQRKSKSPKHFTQNHNHPHSGWFALRV